MASDDDVILPGLRGSLSRLQLEYVDIVFANRNDVNSPMEGQSLFSLSLSSHWSSVRLMVPALLSLVSLALIGLSFIFRQWSLTRLFDVGCCVCAVMTSGWFDRRVLVAEIVRAMTFVINQGMAMYWGTSRWSAMEIMVSGFGELNHY